MASIRSGLIAFALVVGLLAWIGCGGDDGPTGKGGRSAEDGRIFLKNPTDYLFEVSYQDEELETIKTSVGKQETQEVTRGPLEGGTTVMLRVVLLNLRGTTNPTKMVEVKVDGNLTVLITSVTPIPGNPPQFEYSVASGSG